MTLEHTSRCRFRIRLSATFTLLVLLLSACAGRQIAPPPSDPAHTRPYRVNGKWYQPLSSADGFRETGIASWYGKEFHGRRTANGEKYDMYGMTAAHKTLPFGTHLSVRNLTNGKQIQVRVNDRGPFVAGRIIDLSYTAAKRIGIVGPGTAKVRISALRRPAPDKPTDAASASQTGGRARYAFQVGAFKYRENAERQKRLLARKYKDVRIARAKTGNGIIYKVRVGRFTSVEEARDQERELIRDGYPNLFIVTE